MTGIIITVVLLIVGLAASTIYFASKASTWEAEARRRPHVPDKYESLHSYLACMIAVKRLPARFAFDLPIVQQPAPEEFLDNANKPLVPAGTVTIRGGRTAWKYRLPQ